MLTKLFILLVCILIVFLSVIRREKYGFSLKKSIILGVLITFSGVLGTMILGYIETGVWSSISYYGGVFFVPIAFILIAKIVKKPYWEMADYCAPSVGAALLMKVNCLIEGCCRGRPVYYGHNGDFFIFPSQLAELLNAVIIVLILLLLEKKGKCTKRLYPLFFVVYGATRFILNFFRETTPYVGNLSAGHFWSLVSIGIGIICFIVINHKEKVKS